MDVWVCRGMWMCLAGGGHVWPVLAGVLVHVDVLRQCGCLAAMQVWVGAMWVLEDGRDAMCKPLPATWCYVRQCYHH